MTRKDYELIAAAIKQTQTWYGVHANGKHDASHGVEHCAATIADALTGNNPRFGRDRFLKACGVQS